MNDHYGVRQSKLCLKRVFEIHSFHETQFKEFEKYLSKAGFYDT